ncbi:MAG: hypothetical protein ABI333_13890 [bacterium]
MNRKALRSASNRQVELTGRIAPVAWDEVHAVTEVMIEWQPAAQDDPCELLLHPDFCGRALLQFVGRTVTVTGFIAENRDGDPVLLVSTYRLHRSRPGCRVAS